MDGSRSRIFSLCERRDYETRNLSAQTRRGLVARGRLIWKTSRSLTRRAIARTPLHRGEGRVRANGKFHLVMRWPDTWAQLGNKVARRNPKFLPHRFDCVPNDS